MNEQSRGNLSTLSSSTINGRQNSREFSTASSVNSESPLIKQQSLSEYETKTQIPLSISKVSGLQLADSSGEFKENASPIHIPLQNDKKPVEMEKEEDLVVVKAKKGRLRFNFTIGEAITFVAWIMVIVFVAWYISNSISNYVTSLGNPTTSLAYVESLPLYYPAITVCNWNAALDCDYCNLTLMYSTTVNQEYGTIEQFELPHTITEIEQNGQYFTCYGRFG